MENTEKIQEILMNAIFEVFEKMFFVFLEPVDEDIRYDMTASINFSGPTKGTIDVLLTADLASAMVQNMLSIDDDGITPKLVEDCVKESVNMIAGNFLQKYDSSKVFDLSIPTFKKESAEFTAQEAAGKARLNVCFEASEGLLGVRMSFA